MMVFTYVVTPTLSGYTSEIILSHSDFLQSNAVNAW